MPSPKLDPVTLRWCASQAAEWRKLWQRAEADTTHQTQAWYAGKGDAAQTLAAMFRMHARSAKRGGEVMTAGCTHPHLYALERYSHAEETTVPAQWCSACGALCDDGVWRHPTLQAEALASAEALVSMLPNGGGSP